jgi:hypothetical protein
MDEDPILARAQLLISATNNINQNDAINSMMGKESSQQDELIREEEEDTDNAVPQSDVLSINYNHNSKQSMTVVKEAELKTNFINLQQLQLEKQKEQKLDIDESNILLNDPVLVRARLFVEAANGMNPNISTVQNPSVDLTLNIPVLDSNHLIAGTPTSDNSYKETSQSPSKKDKGRGKSSVIVKCTVIQGSTLVSTSIDVRLSLKVGSSVSIDGQIVRISDSIAEWSSNRVALKQDWPHETRFDVELFIESQSLLNRSPTKTHKNTALPVSANSIQNAVSQLDLFLSTRASSNSPAKVSPITMKVNKNGNKLKKERSFVSLVSTPEMSDYNQDDTIISRYIEDKITESSDVIEVSRKLALKRVSQKFKEDQKQAAIDAAFKEEQQAVVILVRWSCVILLSYIVTIFFSI